MAEDADIQPFEVTREVTQGECPWIRGGLHEGQVVYHYLDCTWGVVGEGIPCTRLPNHPPFFEVPADALRPLEAPETASQEADRG